MPPVAAALPGILLNFAIGAAVNIGVGLISNAIAGSQNQAAAASGIELEPRPAVNEPVKAVMGEWATPGRFLHQNSYGDENEYLQLVYECGRGWHEGLRGVLDDGKFTTLSGSNADARGQVIDSRTRSGVPHAWIKYYTGAPGQVADPELVARANPSSRWPATKKLTATAYVIVTLRFDEKVFEAGIPSFRYIWRGLRCYDRRKDSTQPGGSGAHRWDDPTTYEWTANPAILQDNWRRGFWVNGVRLLGLGVPEAACHHARIVAAANLCDEDLFYADTGRTLPRYAMGCEISDDADTISMMRMFETAMAGYGAELGGAYAPIPAQAMASVLTLVDRDRVTGADVSERKRLDPLETKTAYSGSFVSPEDGWLAKDYGLRFDAAVEMEEGGRRQGPLDLQFIVAQETAGMIAEITRRRDRFSATEVAVYGPKAAKLEPGDVITRQSELFGTIPMMVWGVKELSGARYQLSLRAWNNAIVPDAGEGFLPIVPTPIPAPVPTRPVTVSALLAVAATQVSGSNTVPAIRVTWTPITDGTVDRVVIKYWRAGSPDDARYLSVDAPSSGRAVIEGVVPNADYVVTATIVTTPPRTTIWATELPVTTGALTVTASPADGEVDFDKLSDEVKQQVAWLSQGLRSMLDAIERTGRLVAEQDLNNFQTFEQLRRQLSVELGGLTASFNEVIEVALGEGGAIATALSALYAAMGGNSSEVNVRWQALAAPSGFSARYAVQAAVNDGTFRSATFMLDVPENPAEPTRIIFDAGQTLITTDGGETVAAMFDEDGAVIRNLKTGQIIGPNIYNGWDLTSGVLRVGIATP